MPQHLYADCSILLPILPLYCINCLTCFHPDCLVQITAPVLTEIKQGRADPNCGGRGGGAHRAGKPVLSRRSQRRGPPAPPVLPGERSPAALPAAGGPARQPRAHTRARSRPPARKRPPLAPPPGVQAGLRPPGESARAPDLSRLTLNRAARTLTPGPRGHPYGDAHAAAAVSRRRTWTRTGRGACVLTSPAP